MPVDHYDLQNTLHEARQYTDEKARDAEFYTDDKVRDLQSTIYSLTRDIEGLKSRIAALEERGQYE